MRRKDPLTTNELVSTGYLDDLPAGRMRWLEPHLERCTLAAGDTLLHEGETLAWLWVVVEGRLRAERTSGPELLSRGQAVAEDEVLTHGHASSAVVADSDAVVVGIPSSVFVTLLSREPEFTIRLARRIAHAAQDASALVGAAG